MKPKVRPHQPQPIRIPSQAKIRDLVRAARRVCDYNATRGGGGYAAGSGESRIDDLKMALEPFRRPDKVDWYESPAPVRPGRKPPRRMLPASNQD